MALTEGKYTGEFLLTEAPGTISRDNVTVVVPAGTTLPPGTVLGKISASGKFAPYKNDASDGSETARAILYSALKNAGQAPADMTGVVIHRISEVRGADLDWNGQDETAINAGIVDLEARSIIVRD